VTGSAGESPRPRKRAPARPKKPAAGNATPRKTRTRTVAPTPPPLETEVAEAAAPEPVVADAAPEPVVADAAPAETVEPVDAAWSALDPIAQWEGRGPDALGKILDVADGADGGPRGGVAPLDDAEPTGPAPEALHARLATPAERADWDKHTVASLHGHVYQSRAWGEYRAAHGRPVWHIVFGDGFRMLVVGRDRPVVGGGWAYATRGPIPEEHAVLTATRAAAAAELLAGEGLDSFTVDGETPAASGLGRFLEARGFRAVEEVQTSRHRMDVHLGPEDAHNSDEQTIFGSFGATTRNNIRQAERHGLRVKRLDAGGGRAESEYDLPGTLEGLEAVGLEDPDRTARMLRTFYVMLDATAERRGFALASENAFLDWSNRALTAGHMLYLQAEHDVDGPVAGAVFYRHGHRLTYSLAGDRAELRKAHPGAVRLLVWRGIQIALDENRTSVDLGGVDTEGVRGRPDKGDPTYGMYAFKESFGARWVDLTGAYQRTMRPMHNLAGRLIGRITSLRR
jgi:peptidoglycan biosynthesis/recognition FemAB-like protein